MPHLITRDCVGRFPNWRSALTDFDGCERLEQCVRVALELGVSIAEDLLVSQDVATHEESRNCPQSGTRRQSRDHAGGV